MYRDGVGDGMLQTVVNYELAQIMESIKALGQDYAYDLYTHTHTYRYTSHLMWPSALDFVPLQWACTNSCFRTYTYNSAMLLSQNTGQKWVMM